MIEHGFGSLGLTKVWAQTRATNLASQRVLDKCGLTPTGQLEPGVLRYEVSRPE